MIEEIYPGDIENLDWFKFESLVLRDWFKKFIYKASLEKYQVMEEIFTLLYCIHILDHLIHPTFDQIQIDREL